MAITAYKNPRVYAGPPLGAKETVTAVDSQTWKAGQFGYYSTTGKALPCARGQSAVRFQFAEDQDTETSTSTAVITRIQSTVTQFVGYVCAGANDTTAQLTHRGETAGIYVGSNVCIVNVSNDTDAVFNIQGPLWDKEGYKNASTDGPGQVIFTVSAAALVA